MLNHLMEEHKEDPSSKSERTAHSAESRSRGNVVWKEENNRAPRVFIDESYPRVDQIFSGTQTMNISGKLASDTWRVNVEVQGIDLKRGTICGSMEVLDVPKMNSPVLTF